MCMHCFDRCFQLEILAYDVYTLLIFEFSLGCRVATFWEIAARSVSNFFLIVFCLFVIFIYFLFWF